MTQGCNAANVTYISKLMPANATHILTGNIQCISQCNIKCNNSQCNRKYISQCNSIYATTTNTTDNATADAIAIS